MMAAWSSRRFDVTGRCHTPASFAALITVETLTPCISAMSTSFVSVSSVYDLMTAAVTSSGIRDESAGRGGTAAARARLITVDLDTRTWWRSRRRSATPPTGVRMRLPAPTGSALIPAKDAPRRRTRRWPTLRGMTVRKVPRTGSAAERLTGERMNAAVEHATRNRMPPLSALEVTKLLLGDAFDPADWPDLVED